MIKHNYKLLGHIYINKRLAVNVYTSQVLFWTFARKMSIFVKPQLSCDRAKVTSVNIYSSVNKVLPLTCTTYTIYGVCLFRLLCPNMNHNTNSFDLVNNKWVTVK